MISMLLPGTSVPLGVLVVSKSPRSAKICARKAGSISVASCGLSLPPIGLPWPSEASRGLSWPRVVSRGLPWFLAASRGLARPPVVSRALPWSLVVSSGL